MFCCPLTKENFMGNNCIKSLSNMRMVTKNLSMWHTIYKTILLELLISWGIRCGASLWDRTLSIHFLVCLSVKYLILKVLIAQWPVVGVVVVSDCTCLRKYCYGIFCSVCTYIYPFRTISSQCFVQFVSYQAKMTTINQLPVYLNWVMSMNNISFGMTLIYLR